MQMKLDRHFVFTLSGLFIILAALAGIGLINGEESHSLSAHNQWSKEEEIRTLITEITIQRLELNSSFDRYLQACLHKIKTTSRDDFDYKSVNKFLLYDLELQHRFHAEVRNTITNRFEPGEQLELLTAQLQDSEKEVEFLEKNILLGKGLFHDQNADKLVTMMQEIRRNKLLLQEKLHALLTGTKYTEISGDEPEKSSQNVLLIFLMILITGASLGILLSNIYYKNISITQQTPLQLTGPVIRVIEGETVQDFKILESSHE